ncbi:alpha/beta hydrolase [Enterococcus sp. LJL98]
MFTKEISQILTKENLTIEATLYRPSAATQAPIIYLHGGGLVFGQRDDLPLPYIEAFTTAGHPLITLDYLLAPEAKLPFILETLKETLTTVIQQLPEWGFSQEYLLMGRSAGSYLADLLIKGGFQPTRLIHFYGYYTLDVPAFRQPNPSYLVFPRVAPMDVDTLLEPQPIVAGEMGKRYPIYLSGRQFGNWLPRILPSLRDIPTFSVTEEELATFPPTIFIHCRKDADVPYDLSEKAQKIVPHSVLLTIPGEEHDFDRQVSAENLAIYQQVIDFVKR